MQIPIARCHGSGEGISQSQTVTGGASWPALTVGSAYQRGCCGSVWCKTLDSGKCDQHGQPQPQTPTPPSSSSNNNFKNNNLSNKNIYNNQNKNIINNK